MNPTLKKLISEFPMITMGIGFAVAGASAAFIGASRVRKDVYGSAIVMAGGAWFAHVGTQVAIGAVERVRGLR